MEIKIGGIGDAGLQNTFVTHVDDIRIGALHFNNCQLEVFEGKNVLPNVDGLIGADVFRDFLVTLDFPALEMRLSPLPKRPDETAEALSLSTEGDETATPGKSLADLRKDRYVAPEMKDWERFFRSGHFIIFRTAIGNTPRKLFIMDTGAGLNLISPAAAREVTGVSSDTDMQIHGVNGAVKTVFSTGALYLQFAGVRQQTHGLSSIDTGDISRSTGVEVSGFLGYPILKELKIEIDYRDNLAHVSYAPHVELPR